MKLRNKLIPILSLATVSTVVAPIAASCGFTSTDILAEDTLDITTPYTPTIAKADKIKSETTAKKAMDIYMNHVMANPEILKQDLWYHESKRLPSRVQSIEHMGFYFAPDGTARTYYDLENKISSVTDTTATVTISNIVPKKHKVIMYGSEREFYTISMDLNYDFAFKATSLSTEPRVTWDQRMSFKSSYNDIPLTLNSYRYSQFIPIAAQTNLSKNSQWYLSVDLMSLDIQDYLYHLPGWSFTYDISMSYSADVLSHGLTQTYSNASSASDVITRTTQIPLIKDKLVEAEILDGEANWNADVEFAQVDFTKADIVTRNLTLLETLSDGFMNFESYHLSDIEAADEREFNFIENNQATTAKVTYTVGEDGTISFAPVKDGFDLLELGKRFDSIEKYVGDVQIIKNPGQATGGGSTSPGESGELRANAQAADNTDLEMFVDAAYYEQHPEESSHGMTTLTIPSDVKLTKKESITENRFEATNLSISGDIKNLPIEPFKVKFYIPANTVYTVKYSLFGETTEISNAIVLERDVDFWVEFTKAA